MTTSPTPTPPPLDAQTAYRLAEFARACKAAARAVALYPGSHPAIGASLGRLAAATVRLTEAGPCRLQIHADRLLIDGAAASKPDPAIPELAEVLHRHLIGALTINAGADAESWRTLLLLLARTPEEIRADGGIAHLWLTAGGPSLEIQEFDYGEVLREKQGRTGSLDEIIAAALAGRQMQLDDSGLRELLDAVSDPGRLQELMSQLEGSTQGHGADVKTAAFLNLLRGLADYVSRTSPDKLDTLLRQMGTAAGRLSAEGMMTLLAQQHRPEPGTNTAQLVGAVVDRMPDSAVVEFVAGSVRAEGGATDRLAHAFQALVPEMDRQRKLLALARDEVSASEMGEDESGFTELWGRVEGMLTSYSDANYVSADYGRELSSARTRAVDVERTSDDPPDRIAAWLSTVNDSALRGLDHQLLLDLLAIENNPLRWRDVAETVVAHADDLVRVGYFDQAWELAERVIERSERVPELQEHATRALEQFGRGSMMKHVATHLRNASDESCSRFMRLCHAMGTPVIAPLAEVLSTEHDARSRHRLRDVLVGFGARGREAVQQLMHATNWEVRRTAAYLLREFGGAEGLKELVPLLTDTEPLVQREAIQALMLNGSTAASELLFGALKTATGRSRQTLINELVAMRDERAAPLFAYLLRRVNRRALLPIYEAAIEALGQVGGGDGVDALKFALHQADWWAPLRTRRLRTAAAAALRRIGKPEAIEVLREASARGPRSVRAAARAELARV